MMRIRMNQIKVKMCCSDNQDCTQYEYKFSDEDIQMIAKLSDKENDNADTEKVTE